MEHKTVVAAEIELRSASQGTIEAVFSTLNVKDHDGDVTLPGAFTEGQKVMISAHNHASWKDKPPVGRGTIHTVGNEAILRGQLFMDTSQGRDAYNTIKGAGELQELSYGFDVLDSEPGTFGGERVRFLKKMRVYEVSPVLKAAGVGTRVLSLKSNYRDDLKRMRREFLGEPTDPYMQHQLLIEYAKFQRDGLEMCVAEVERLKDSAFKYRLTTDVPYATVKAAREGLRDFSDYFPINPEAVNINWFAEVKSADEADYLMDESCWGFTWPDYTPDDIWIAAKLSPDQARSVAIHEARHAYNNGTEEQAVFTELAFKWGRENG